MYTRGRRRRRGRGTTDGYDAAQPFEHFSLVPAVEQLLELGDWQGMRRGLAEGTGIAGSLEGEVACCERGQ